MSRIGSTERTASLKALLAWVDRGILKEDEGDIFRLLEHAETSTAQRSIIHRPIIEDEPTATVAQQQQAAQMQVYWKVRLIGATVIASRITLVSSSSRECSPIWANFLSNEYRVCLNSLPGMTERKTNSQHS